jgi:hypothetical protein
MAEILLFAFHDDAVYKFVRADTYSASVFGGPLRAKLSGRAFGPKPLHHIARLGACDMPALVGHQLFDLPLIYGMYYCGLQSYRVEYGHDIQLLYIETATPAEDFPYPDFPPLLPYLPLKLQAEPSRESYTEFAERFPNMPERQRAELIVAVPPLATIGLTLWGDDGDGEDVTMVFECDLKNKIVSAYNVCS